MAIVAILQVCAREEAGRALASGCDASAPRAGSGCPTRDALPRIKRRKS
jgi:hypothetical protein